jgi:TolB protein
MSTRTDPLGEIYVMNADGSYLTRLTFSAGADDAPAWSNDGKRIAFTSTRDGDTEVYVMNADGSGQTRLTNSPGLDEHPAFSPDGKKIAFVSGRQDPAGLYREVYVMNADGSGPSLVTAMQEIASFPAWAPGGKQIAFSTGGAIYVINVDGTGLAELVPGGHDPTYSPDGKSIAFSEPYGGGIELFTANADGSAQTRITFETAVVSRRPSWGR